MKYLQELGEQIGNIKRLLKVTTKKLTEMTGVDIKKIETNPHIMTKSDAMRIFIIANASAKFEQDQAIKALLALCFQIDKMDTAKFIKKINEKTAA